MSKSKIAKGQAAKKRMKEGNKIRQQRVTNEQVFIRHEGKDWTVGELLGTTLKQST